MGAAGCGGAGDSAADTTTPTTTTPSVRGAAAVKPVADASLCKHVKPSKVESASYDAPEQTVRRGEKLTAVVKTSCGVFEIELDTKRSLTTVNSFAFLARKGFYDGLEFDRAGAGTYVHGGDPPGDAVGPGYSVQEDLPSGLFYKYRTVVMAQSFEAPIGTSGSQFFVMLAKPWGDIEGLYPPLGKVSKGIEALERISALGPVDRYPGGNIGSLGEVGPLRRPVLIEGISIERG